MGVSGAAVIVDSLLGTIVAEPDFDLRWEFMARVGDVPSVGLLDPTGPRLSGEGGEKAFEGSVGVGGVLTMTGLSRSTVGGVLGASSSTLGLDRGDLVGDATLTGAGGSRTGAPNDGGLILFGISFNGDEVYTVADRPLGERDAFR